MRSPKRWLMVVLMVASWEVSAQDASPFLSDVDSLLTFNDSLSIFNLIDSLLQLEDQSGSLLSLRIGYNSNVLSTGRTLGIENFGLAPGISYYHRSGFYADVTGYWSKDFDPEYYLTVATLGYMRDFSKHVSIMGGYDRYFYTIADEDSYIPYKNTLSVTPLVEFRPVMFSVNYSFYFGDAQAHRIMPGLSFIFEKKKWIGIDRISLNPGFYALFGNETFTSIEYVPPKNLQEAIQNRRKYGTRYKIVETTTKVFGEMNYAISVPLSVTHKNWNFMFTYSYSIPKPLPGETLTLSESSYLSASLSYFIDFNPRKSSL